ncbi:MAG: Filamentous hemagglutinin family outer membrane protein [Syntrophorhabdus sp. PtaU1.Bin058]|nr:MAG: Filamentous hemagglutinin family outer membrane protein [Syntrophorhabdus sp. PtaU1.Bin058]
MIFRDPPPPTGYPARMSLAGTVRGASSVIAQIDQIYEGYSTITSTVINQIRTDITNFMNTYGDSLKTTLLSHLILDGVSQDAFHLQPGVVIQQTGDITLSSDWDMTSWRFLGEPGTLTLRAGGNLNIYANLIDHPTALANLPGTSGRDSWGINLVAGADLSSSDLMVVKQGTGNLTIGPDNTNAKLVGGKMVYSESAPVRFASGGDTLIRSGPATGYMINSSIRYTLGSYDGDITGYVGGNLTIKGGAIQTAISDINITVAGNLVMDYGNDYNTTNTSIGSIRTTGQHQTPSSANMLFYWEYEDGGDIVLEIGKSLIGRVNQNSDTKKNAWDNPYKYYDRDTGIWSTNFDVWAASYPGAPRTSGYETTEGLVTMAGGDIRVHAGGDFFIQTGTFGEGDLKIYAGGNIDGRFLVKEGAGEIHSLANFGVKQMANQSIELFDAQVNLSAQGDIRIGTFLNPMIANLSFTDWNLQYGTESSVKLRAVTGDVSLSGDSAFYSLTTSYQNRERILPPIVEIRAGRDILLSNEFALVPSPTGNLVLEAGRDINGAYGDEKRSSFVVSDMLPDDVYGLHKGFAVSSLFNPNEHALSVHTEDPVPIQITAIEGDIKNLQLALPKFACIEAGQDIIDIYYLGQNVNPEDITLIRAGRNLLFSEAFGTDYDTGIVHGGPGTLIVQAGNNIDLGTTSGIQTVGNGYNSALDKTKGSDLIVAAGIGIDLDPYTMKELFDVLRDVGRAYTWLRGIGSAVIPDSMMDESFFVNLKNAGRDYYTLLRGKTGTAGANAIADDARKNIILPVIGEEEEGTEGVLDMVRSQISTKAGTDNIYLLVRGDLNLGKSSFVSDADRKNTGVFTAAGGAINILGGGDVNVNEARVMTFRGGDITVYALWNNDSVVNAGRGSKTAINVEPPMTVKEYEYVQEGGKTVKRLKSQTIVFEPPSVGSGIRTLTYDPDGEAGPLKAPSEGDIYIFASTIDAGEAGIRGRNVTLGAQTVVNVQNISFSVGAVGITTQSQGGVSLGALTGSTSLNAAASVSQDMTAMAAGRTPERAMQQPIEDIMKWVDVKVIGYDLNAPTIGGPDEQEGGQES